MNGRVRAGAGRVNPAPSRYTYKDSAGYSNIQAGTACQPLSSSRSRRR